jgi:hypothetical protein
MGILLFVMEVEACNLKMHLLGESCFSVEEKRNTLYYGKTGTPNCTDVIDVVLSTMMSGNSHTEYIHSE